jgi:heme-degrading monooxygenase HmoA
VLARVMTFYSASEKISDLFEVLRTEMPPAYESIPGFRGVVVLEKPGGNHMIAETFWEDEEGIKASESMAADYARRIGLAAGTTVSVNVYEVVGIAGLSAGEKSAPLP